MLTLSELFCPQIQRHPYYFKPTHNLEHLECRSGSTKDKRQSNCGREAVRAGKNDTCPGNRPGVRGAGSPIFHSLINKRNGGPTIAAAYV